MCARVRACARMCKAPVCVSKRNACVSKGSVISRIEQIHTVGVTSSQLTARRPQERHRTTHSGAGQGRVPPCSDPAVTVDRRSAHLSSLATH